MPISREDFERSGDSVASVLDFLRLHRNFAFTLKELVGELAQLNINLDEDELREILNDVERRGQVESKTIRGLVYYIYAAKIGFRPSRG